MKKILTFFLVVMLSFNNIYSQDEFLGQSNTIGGYGELHFNKVVKDGEKNNTLDFHRFVIFYGHQWNEQWSFKAEVEIEHNFVSEGEGELELEQAMVDYHYSDYFGLQAGVLLPSVGLMNEAHEPPLFFGVERPDYQKYIVPTTWYGSGISLYGNFYNFDYKITVMEGLNADKFSNGSGIRGGRQKGYKSNANHLLYNARVNYLGINGLTIGTSATFNNAFSETKNILFFLVEGHLKLVKNNIYITGEIASINYESGDLKTSFGYYVDLGYDFSRLFKIKTKLIPFVRFSNYNTAQSTVQSGDSEKEFNKKKWLVGMNILPLDEVVVKVDYGEMNVELSDKTTKYFNLGIGYMF